MNPSALSLRPALVACVAAPAPVTLPNEKSAQVQPLDLLIVTSRADFHQETLHLLACAHDQALHADKLFIEDLTGANDGERLQDLHHRMGALRSSGKLPDSAAIYVTLHGARSFRFASPQDMYQRRPHLAEFIRFLHEDGGTSLGQSCEPTTALMQDRLTTPDNHRTFLDSEAGDASAMSADDASGCGSMSPRDTDESSLSDSDTNSDAAGRLPTHCLTRHDGRFSFPSDLFFLALRHARMVDGTCTSDYQGVVFLSSCFGGQLVDQLGNHGGSILILNGRKSGTAIDAEECMLEAIDLMAESKRQRQLPLTARDYWLRLRHVSGEHIVCLMHSECWVHKPLQSTEPLLAVLSGRSAGQPQRVLESKLIHGSPNALQAVFDKYGTQRFSHYQPEFFIGLLGLDIDSHPIDIGLKLQVLEDHGIALFETTADVCRWLRAIIAEEKEAMLGAILSHRREGRLPEPVLASLPDCLFDLDDPDTPNALQSLCELSPELEALVSAWLIEGADWFSARQRAAVKMDRQPYFLALAFTARCSRVPAVLRDAVNRHGAQSIRRYRTDHIADSDKSIFIHDPGRWLSHALCRALIDWRDKEEADALITAAASLDSPLDLKATLDIAFRYGKAQGRSEMAGFLNTHGFRTDS